MKTIFKWKTDYTDSTSLDNVWLAVPEISQFENWVFWNFGKRWNFVKKRWSDLDENQYFYFFMVSTAPPNFDFECCIRVWGVFVFWIGCNFRSPGKIDSSVFFLLQNPEWLKFWNALILFWISWITVGRHLLEFILRTIINKNVFFNPKNRHDLKVSIFNLI